MRSAIEDLTSVDFAWARARPIHFAALYIRGHEIVYGIAPLEMTSLERIAAANAASRTLAKHFNGDGLAFVAFIDWVWARAKRRAQWAESNDREVTRVAWRHLFGGYLLTDYFRAQLTKIPKAPVR